MTIDDKADYSNKKGILSVYIPILYQKAGRQFAVMAIGQGGEIYVFNDVDENPVTVTCSIDVSGYAFDLIYKD